MLTRDETGTSAAYEPSAKCETQGDRAGRAQGERGEQGAPEPEAAHQVPGERRTRHDHRGGEQESDAGLQGVVARTSWK